MTAIWFILALMTGLAVLALLWPLTRRSKRSAEGEPESTATQTRFYEDQLAEIERDLARGLIAPPEADAARTEAARRLLRANREDETVEQRAGLLAEPKLRHRRAASAFALSTVPLVALLVYGIYGSPNLPSQTAADREAARSGGQDLMKAIAQIEAKLASDPNDARGWGVIAPVYMRLGRFDDAARAYENLVRIDGEDADRLASWGEALVAAGEGNVSPQARSLFERALAVDPKAAKPQFYLARGDELTGNRAGAIARLKALSEQGPADAPWMVLVKDNLTRLSNEAAPAQEAGSVSRAKPVEGAQDGQQDASKKAESKSGPPAAGPSANLEALPPAERMAAIRGMVENLDRRLDAQGGSVEEWIRLVRSYGALGQRDKALAVLERARKAFAEGSDERAALEAQARELGLAAVETPPAERGEAAPAAADLVHPPGNAEAEAAIRAMPPAERDAMIRQMVDRLAQRLSAKGGSPDEWMRLVRSYSALGDRQRAADAFERARMALAADNAALDRLDTLGRELKLRTAAAKK